jgi:hypothetical protein
MRHGERAGGRGQSARAPAFGPVAFLIGCPRSGTSILGEAIAEHPRVAYLFEESSIWNRIAAGKDDHRLEGSDATAEAIAAARAGLAVARADLPGDLLVEKNPKHVLRVPFLSAVFPEARFLHLVRDARDTVASLMFRNRGAQWGHVQIPGWRELLARYPAENHIRCAHQWRDAVATARADGGRLPAGSYLELRYEGLLADPADVVGRALDFLGLGPDPQVAEFVSRIQDATAGSYHAKKQVRHYVEDHTRRVGRHLENLSERQIAEVEAICGELNRELGYE